MSKFDEAILSSLVNKEQHLQLTKEKYRNNQHLQKMLISKEERHDLVVKQLELAQKQDKLLKLYQEYYKADNLTTEDEIDIIKQIKELENEL